MTYKEIEEKYGITHSALASAVHRLKHRPEKMSEQYLYRVLHPKTKQLLAEGTAEECAKQLGMKTCSFYASISRCLSGERNTYIIIRLQGKPGSKERKKAVECET
jgi:hypothetical protein